MGFGSAKVDCFKQLLTFISDASARDRFRFFFLFALLSGIASLLDNV